MKRFDPFRGDPCRIEQGQPTQFGQTEIFIFWQWGGYHIDSPSRDIGGRIDGYRFSR
jgi:hypothetical protein